MASYQAMNGLGGLAWAGPRDITWEGRDQVYFPWWNEGGSMPMRPFACGGPSTLGQFPAAAAIARRGLVARAPVVFAETRTAAQIIGREEPRISEEFADDPNRFARGERQDTTITGGIPKEAFLIGPVTVKLAEKPAPAAVADLRPFISDGVVTSATRQLRMDAGHGLFTVDAPAAQVAVGFLRQAGKISLTQAAIRCDLEHGTVAVVSLDGKPLSGSARILVQIGARSVPTGWREHLTTSGSGAAARQGLAIDATGDLPWRVRRVSGSVSLPLCAATRATVLDGNGLPRGAWPVTKSMRGISFDLPPDAPYLVLE